MQGDRKRTPMPIREIEEKARGNGPVTTYYLSPDELEEYRRKTGEPTRKLPDRAEVDMSPEKQRERAMKKYEPKEEESMSQMTKEQYLTLRAAGMGRTEIMKKHYGRTDSFYKQLREWGIKERDAEDRELEMLSPPVPMPMPRPMPGPKPEPAITLDESEDPMPEVPRVETRPVSSLASKLEELLLDYNATAKIKQWAIDRNLHTADPTKQVLKLGEEYGELCQGMAKGNQAQIIDSIGDIYVVLTVLSLQLGLDIESCIDQAYEEIKDRKGQMVNGVFVKESDLGA